MVYESESIYKGEMAALNQFILKAMTNGNFSKYSVEDLLFDEFFEAENFSEMYNEYISKELERETIEEERPDVESRELWVFVYMGKLWIFVYIEELSVFVYMGELEDILYRGW